MRVRLLSGHDLNHKADLTTADLLDLYAVDDAAPLVRANMVVSLDGRTTGSDDVSGGLSSGADKVVFSLLRSLSDVVLVGAGTARSENYRPAKVGAEFADARRARGRHQPPIIAVVSRSLSFDASNPLYTRGQMVFITDQSADPDALERAAQQVEVICTPGSTVDLADAIAALRERELLHIVTEGGPQLLGDALDQDVVDELCLTISPLIVGGKGHQLLGKTDDIDARFALGHLIEDDGVLLTRYVRNRS